MKYDEFSDAALIVLGHGTEQNAGSAAPVYQHAAELRRRKIFAEVHEAFWKQEPQVKSVLAGIAQPRIFIAPLFISEGFFGDDVIPRGLGFQASRIMRCGSSSLFYCRPVGSHDSMTHVVLSRARDVVEKFPFPRAPRPGDVSLFIAGHGTEKNDNSRKPVDRQVELIRSMNLYSDVQAIFLEEPPHISECYRLAQAKNLVVVPFFISDGLHTQEDIPVLLGEPRLIVRERLGSGHPVWRNPSEKNGKLVWYTSAVGGEPHMADVILERVREAAKMEGAVPSAS